MRALALRVRGSVGQSNPRLAPPPSIDWFRASHELAAVTSLLVDEIELEIQSLVTCNMATTPPPLPEWCAQGLTE